MQEATHVPHTHPHDPHIEGHFESTETVRDIVIGLSDGLTVPFALAAGLSGAVASSTSSSSPVWPKLLRSIAWAWAAICREG
jgi:hypothetical protein